MGECNLQINLKKTLSSQQFQMKDLGPVQLYLGMHITRNRHKRLLWLDQVSYIENALKRFNLSNAKSTRSPLPGNVHLEKGEEISTAKN